MRDHASDVVGKAAVGLGDIARAFKYRDLSLFVQSADTGGSRGSSGGASDDYNFHMLTSLSFRDNDGCLQDL